MNDREQLIQDTYNDGITKFVCAGYNIQSSLDSNCLNAGSWACANYNYLTKYKYAFWTITANSDNSYQAYFVDNFAKVGTTSRGAYIRLTAVINGKINYKSGTGTETDPYIIEPITVK